MCAWIRADSRFTGLPAACPLRRILSVLSISLAGLVMSLTVRALAPTVRSHTTTGLLGRLRLGDRFRAFQYRDFRMIFFGQAVSAVGGWMQMVAQGWLVYALTGSPFYIGLVAL